MLIVIAFSWRTLQAVFFGQPLSKTVLTLTLPPITLAERVGAGLLLASTVLLGLYPHLLMRLILPALHGPMFEQLRRGEWR